MKEKVQSYSYHVMISADFIDAIIKKMLRGMNSHCNGFHD